MWEDSSSMWACIAGISHVMSNNYKENTTPMPDAVTIKVSSGIFYGGMIHEQKQLL